eukprot:CAMPEP_0195253396 /NCGR_PEP_ID=MMETSP0706-20130129/4436_1 /TAXON_ID=33640 /ORGANISM="Asterionellopsis glacialis, Strain CCMP134" /LENGTH=51 /DNA_ID=CAMNT_0040305881 /DNA_START=510 /DNA_END=665 /DNA_ORIENTATION=-
MEMPSTPIWYEMPEPSQSIFSTIWNPGFALSNPIQTNSENTNVNAVTINDT